MPTVEMMVDYLDRQRVESKVELKTLTKAYLKAERKA
jgi:hypothetical protein